MKTLKQFKEERFGMLERDPKKSAPKKTRKETEAMLKSLPPVESKEVRQFQTKVAKIMRMGRPMKLKNGKVSMAFKEGFVLTPEELLKLAKAKIAVDVTKKEVVFYEWKGWS